jgi:uncharacterized membrane protein
VKRLAFLDWMRGLAVLIMIPCHTFNSFTRMDLRQDGWYIYSQFIGGMAAPLFLFMAGMTLGFQMESLDRREPRPLFRWFGALRRAGYVWGIAYLFRSSNWVVSFPNGNLQELTKVDILNCMGLGMAAMAAAAAVGSRLRVQFALAAGLAIAGAAPIVANLDWTGVPQLIHEYLAPGLGRGRFAFFPCAAYVAFGIAAGVVVKRTPAEHMERLMQWSVPAGFALVFSAEYLSGLPYSIYAKSNFWTDSPALILIRVGISLLILAGAYVWTEYCVSPRWSWVQTLGKTSLMVYWVHVMLVYGSILKPMKRALDIPLTVLATLGVTAAMVGLATAKLSWTRRRAERRLAAAAATAAAV